MTVSEKHTQEVQCFGRPSLEAFQANSAGMVSGQYDPSDDTLSQYRLVCNMSEPLATSVCVTDSRGELLGVSSKYELGSYPPICVPSLSHHYEFGKS